MTTIERIANHLRSMAEPEQKEVLDFVEFLQSRHETSKDREEDAMWTDLSLASAMRGMEDEDSPYTQADIKESFR